MGSLAFLLGFILFLYCCTIHTKSSNPIIERRRPHRSIRDDIRTISTIQRSVRKRISTIRRSRKAKSVNFEVQDEKLKSYSVIDKPGTTDTHETKPLKTTRDTGVEVDVHDEKLAKAEKQELHELEPLAEILHENG